MYVGGLSVHDIPWHRLVCTYGWAEDFPALLERVSDGSPDEAAEALKTLSGEIEHQDTLWPCTPFALVFLVRLLKEICLRQDGQRMDTACGIVDILKNTAQVCRWAFGLEHADPLPCFADMLNEENLPPRGDRELPVEEGLDFSDELFFSFYYYSFEILKSVEEIYKMTADGAVRAAMAGLNETISFCAETD